MFQSQIHFVLGVPATAGYLHERMAKKRAPIASWAMAIDRFMEEYFWIWLRIEGRSVFCFFLGYPHSSSLSRVEIVSVKAYVPHQAVDPGGGDP